MDFDNLEDWPTFADLKKEYSKTKEQAHSDYIVDKINSYGLPIDIVVEAKAKELCILMYKKKVMNNRKIIHQTVA